MSEYNEFCDNYGEENARWLIEAEYKNYQRVVFIHTVGDCDDFVKYSKEVANFLKIKFCEVQGSLRYFERLVNGEWDTEFLVIPPGKTILLSQFM
jgi:hypothetical protein